MTDSDARKPGLRNRFRTPAPPAPVPSAHSTYATRAAAPAPDLSKPPTGSSAAVSSTQPTSANATATTGAATGATGSATANAANAAAAPTVASSTGVAVATGPQGAAPGAAGGSGGSRRSRANEGAAGTSGQDSGDSSSASDKASDESVVRSTGSMAIATLISRITGFIRNVLIVTTLGGAVSSAFNVANTLPNLITEIVLGAVLTSLVVPVLVRAEKEDPDHGAAFIRRLLTVSLSLLGVVTVAVVIGAPLLTAMMLKADGEVNIPLTTAFAYLLLPQIIFYGVFSLLMAVLNTKGVFRPGAWAPVANNVIAIGTLLLYRQLPGTIEADHSGSLSDPYILLLGLGTTLGVVVQALIMLPSLRRLGIDLRPLWGIDDRVKQFTNMGIAIVAYVAISQTGYVITTKIASGAAAEAPTIYQQAWLLLQMPYGIIGVTLLTAIMPRLSRNAADGNTKEVIRDLSLGTRLTMIALIPIVVFFTAFGRPIANALFAYDLFDSQQADILGWTLSFSSFTLIPYALVLLHLRVFYAREEAWTPTFIILGITLVKVVLSTAAPLVASSSHLVVVLLGAANGFGFVAGAIIGYVLLRRTLGDLDTRAAFATVLGALGASIAGVAVAWGIYLLTDIELLQSLGSIGYLLRTGIAGVIFLVVTGLVLSRIPLPEVKALGRVLARVPGLRRLAPKESEDASIAAATGAEHFGSDGFSVGPNSLIGESSALANEGFTASPLLPPMPTQGSRSIRFVPGEMVSNGRFRLRTRIMERPGIRFWRASDQGAPEYGDVALIFIDTTVLPDTGMRAVDAAKWIAEYSWQLKKFAGPGLARIRTVTATHTDLLIVADWKPSISLADVTSPPHPDSAAFAAVSLAETAAAVHQQGLVFGLDDISERFRLDTDGQMYNAFPVVLPTASKTKDIQAVTGALGDLLQTCTSVPKDIQQAIGTALAQVPGDDSDSDTTPAKQLAEDLRAAVLGPESGQIPVIPSEPTVSARPDTVATASRQETRRAFKTGALIVSIVIVGAIVAALLFGLFNQSDDAPITSDSVRHGTEAAEQSAKKVLSGPVTISEAREWQAANDTPGAGPDDPESAPLVIDGDIETFWSTSNYLDQFGTGPMALKPGVGVVVKLAQTATLSEVSLTATPGALVEIRVLPNTQAADVAATRLVGSATAGAGVTTIPIEDEAVTAQYVLVWITQLPTADEAAAATDGAAQEDAEAAQELIDSSSMTELLPVRIAEVEVIGSRS